MKSADYFCSNLAHRQDERQTNRSDRITFGTGERTYGPLPRVGTGERTYGPLPRAKFHVYRGNVSPLRGEKPIFGPLSKNNTGMAALRAGLSVINT